MDNVEFCASVAAFCAHMHGITHGIATYLCPAGETAKRFITNL